MSRALLGLKSVRSRGASSTRWMKRVMRPKKRSLRKKPKCCACTRKWSTVPRRPRRSYRGASAPSVPRHVDRRKVPIAIRRRLPNRRPQHPQIEFELVMASRRTSCISGTVQTPLPLRGWRVQFAFAHETHKRRLSLGWSVAERVGFEPTSPVTETTRFPGVPVQPLQHLSRAPSLTNPASYEPFFTRERPTLAWPQPSIRGVTSIAIPGPLLRFYSQVRWRFTDYFGCGIMRNQPPG